MAKLTLNNIAAGYQSNAAANTNNDLIEAALENTLSRDGTSPNQMGANLDMDSHKVINLAEPINANEAARLVDVQNAIAGNSTANLVGFTPYGNIASTTVQGAIQEEVDDLAASSGSSLVGFLQSGTGATARTIQSKLRDVVSVKDFGAVGDGVTDDTVAILAAMVYASSVDSEVVFDGTGTYLTGAITLDGTSCPTGVRGNGATLIAKEAMTSVVTISGISAIRRTGFLFGNFRIDADGLAQNGLLITGMQSANVGNILAINSLSDGVVVKGAVGFGVYYNTFSDIRSGLNGNTNGGHGFKVYTDGGVGNYVANNTFIACQAQFCIGSGWYIDWASNSYIACSAEKCDGNGFTLDNTYSSTFSGGYSELNNEAYASTGVTDGTPDVSFNLTANAIGVKVLGGRHLGTVTGTTSGQANVFMLDNYTNPGTRPSISPEGAMRIGSLAVANGSGIGLGGASPIADNINTVDNTGVAVSGTSVMLFNTTDIRALKPIRIQDFNARLYGGNGSPEGVVSATVGSIYLNNTGGAGTSMYVKEAGSGNTGWVAK